MARRGPSKCAPSGSVLHDRLQRMLLAGREVREDRGGGDGRHISIEYLQGGHPGDPHHRGGGVADHAARAAGIAGGDDRGEKADVHTLLVEHGGHGAADHRGRDVVEEAREHEHQQQQHETAFPVVRQVIRQQGGQSAAFEVVCEQRESQQQSEQVGERHPFVGEQCQQTGHTGHAGEIPEAELVRRDDEQAGDRHQQGVVVKQRHTQQRQGEQDEIQGNSGNCHVDLRRGLVFGMAPIMRARPLRSSRDRRPRRATRLGQMPVHRLTASGKPKSLSAWARARQRAVPGDGWRGRRSGGAGSKTRRDWARWRSPSGHPPSPRPPPPST